MTSPKTVLADICSALQYLVDRGEAQESIKATLTKVRWTHIQKVDYVDIITDDNQILRISAEVIGTHEHDFSFEPDYCHICGESVE